MKELPRFTGDDPLVDDLNRAMDCIRELRPIATPDFPIEFHPHGYKPKPKAVITQSEGGDQVWL
jgi:hypothetical protein